MFIYVVVGVCFEWVDGGCFKELYLDWRIVNVGCGWVVVVVIFDIVDVDVLGIKVKLMLRDLDFVCVWVDDGGLVNFGEGGVLVFDFDF